MEGSVGESSSEGPGGRAFLIQQSPSIDAPASLGIPTHAVTAARRTLRRRRRPDKYGMVWDQAPRLWRPRPPGHHPHELPCRRGIGRALGAERFRDPPQHVVVPLACAIRCCAAIRGCAALRRRALHAELPVTRMPTVATDKFQLARPMSDGNVCFFGGGQAGLASSHFFGRH